MELTSISARRIYGRLSLRHRIEPVTVFVGRNETGKSTALGIIELVLNGNSGATWPLLGKSPDYDWNARLAFDRHGPGVTDGFTIERGQTDGSHTLSFDGGRGGLKRNQEKVDHAVGRAARFSVLDLMDETAQKRMQWLQSNVLDGAGWSIDQTYDALEAALDDADTRLDMGQLEDMLGGWPQARDGRDWLGTILVVLQTKEKAANSEALRLKKVVDQDRIDASQNPLPPGTVAQWQARLAEIDAELQQAHEARGKLAGGDVSREHLERDHTLKQRRMSWLRDPAHAAQAEQVKAQAKETRAKLDAVNDRLTEQNAARDQAQAALKASRARLDELVGIENQARLDARTDYYLHDEINPELLALVWKLVDAIWNAPIGVPPTAETYKATEAAAALRDRLPPLDGGMPVAALRMEEALKPHTEATAAQRTIVERDQRRLDAAQNAAYATAQEQVLLEREHARLATSASHLADQVKAQAEEQTILAAEIEALTTQLAQLGTGATDAIDAQIEALNTERRDVLVKINRLNDATNEQAARAENQMRYEDAVEERTSVREALKPVTDTWNRLLAELLAPLAEPVSAFTTAILGAEWAVDASQGFDWALRRGDANLAYGSHSARAVAMLGLRLAIAERLGGWRSLILDDMEHLDPDRRTRLLTQVIELVEQKRLDTFVGAVVDDGDWKPPKGVHIIHLE